MKKYNNILVLVDDMSYSGGQLIRKLVKCSNARFAEIWVCMPFITRCAHDIVMSSPITCKVRMLNVEKVGLREKLELAKYDLILHWNEFSYMEMRSSRLFFRLQTCIIPVALSFNTRLQMMPPFRVAWLLGELRQLFVDENIRPNCMINVVRLGEHHEMFNELVKDKRYMNSSFMMFNKCYVSRAKKWKRLRHSVLASLKSVPILQDAMLTRGDDPPNKAKMDFLSSRMLQQMSKCCDIKGIINLN
jgi:hypothetical protein